LFLINNAAYPFQGERIMKFFKETADKAKHQAEQAAVALD
jgi:hypothetical protein